MMDIPAKGPIKVTIHDRTPDMRRYAIVEAASGKVINASVGSEDWVLAVSKENPALVLIAHEEAGPGWTFEGGELIRPSD